MRINTVPSVASVEEEKELVVEEKELNIRSLIKTVDLFGEQISMHIFDYDYHYKNINNENLKRVGLDIISKCIEGHDNCWEPYQTEITKEILKDGNNIFIDIGCHLGYYSLLASTLNNFVYSIDISEPTVNLFLKSINQNSFSNITFHKKLVNEQFNLNEIVSGESYIKLIKCDIEGNEIEFVEVIFERLKKKSIEFLILEISPKIRNNYPECVLKIKNLGYDVYDIGLSPQRRLSGLTNLQSLKEHLLTMDKLEAMTSYINNFPEFQSNFLFTHVKI